ncbi:hypothetical protein HKCCSP123_02350 [Rhodobacterales bacterium HKCCSP123]|nr:hypothetical protein [Rhodobacterales bacterium HKCCSP123]
MRVTGVVIIHNDSALLRHALDSARDHVDQLVVVDGAYEWVAPFCRLNGEDPERSTDGLIDVLEGSGLPYRYITGTWRNETHKRTVSLEASDTDRVMRIDADEIYQIDGASLDAFWRSSDALGSLYAPLFLHPDTILAGVGSALAPRAPVFFNLGHAGIEDILSGLWLVRPGNEAPGRRRPVKTHAQPLGTFFHLTAFRPAATSYRRARFYCLVSMRMTGRVGLGINRAFKDDRELLGIVSGLDQEAVDLAFRLHRIAASFPEVGPRQTLRPFEVSSRAILEEMSAIHRDMLRSQTEKARAHLGRDLRLFSGRPCFLDVTEEVKTMGPRFRLDASDGCLRSMRLHMDYGHFRETVDGGDIGMVSGKGAMVGKLRRSLLEFSIRPRGGLIDSARLHVD